MGRLSLLSPPITPIFLHVRGRIQTPCPPSSLKPWSLGTLAALLSLRSLSRLICHSTPLWSRLMLQAMLICHATPPLSLKHHRPLKRVGTPRKRSDTSDSWQSSSHIFCCSSKYVSMIFNWRFPEGFGLRPSLWQIFFFWFLMHCD